MTYADIAEATRLFNAAAARSTWEPGARDIAWEECLLDERARATYLMIAAEMALPARLEQKTRAR